MKVIYDGIKNYSRWWHGAELHCPTCNRIVKLEPSDYNHMLWCPTGDGNKVSVACANCDHRLVLENKEATQ